MDSVAGGVLTGNADLALRPPLAQGLEGASVDEVLAVPADMPRLLGLDRAVSPLRLRGMAGMLARIKRRVREETAA